MVSVTYLTTKNGITLMRLPVWVHTYNGKIRNTIRHQSVPCLWKVHTISCHESVTYEIKKVLGPMYDLTYAALDAACV